MTKPTTQQAKDAVNTLLKYLGEDTEREGLKNTPARVVKSYKELFSGYNADIRAILDKKFYEIRDYDNIIILKAISFTSMCEHHMLPFSGKVDIAYLPNGSILGISKLARLVDAFSKRLQIQERMTTDIAKSLDKYLKPKGVAIRVCANHSCMTFRGAMKEESYLESTHFIGEFKNDTEMRNQFWQMINNSP